MSLLSRIFIVLATLGLLLPSAGLAAYQEAVSEVTGKHQVAVSGWNRHIGLWDRAGTQTGERLIQSGKELLLAKAQTVPKRKD